MDDPRSRLAYRAQISTDGHRAYLAAMESAFDCDVDMRRSSSNTAPRSRQRAATTPPNARASTVSIEGKPHEKHISTSFVEVHDKTMRMHMRRFTRLTNGRSKKVANHAYMVALYNLFYNFVRMHRKLRVSPAIAAGIATTFISFEDVIAEIDAAQARQLPKFEVPTKSEPRK